MRMKRALGFGTPVLCAVLLCGWHRAEGQGYAYSAAMPVEQTTYRIVYQTVYEPVEITTYRTTCETQLEERKVVSYKPVWETQYREQRYTVSRLVPETSVREERVRVLKPVWETQYRDESYNVVRYVQETAEREERVRVLKPVWETSEREEVYTVMRPVKEVVYRTDYTTVTEPVVTYRTQYVDLGQYREQLVLKPGLFQNRLSWESGRPVVDPATGAVTWQPGGLYWVPNNRGRYEVRQVWQPNVVAQTVPQTQLVAKSVPVQVPVEVTRYQPEEVRRKVPVQTCRMVEEEQVRKIPVTVTKPVVERVEKQVPVQVCRMVEEEQVRQIPVTVYKQVCEERVQQIPVQVCRMAVEERIVQIPRTVQRVEAVTYTTYRPRTIACRVPVDPCLVPLESVVPSPTYAIPGGSLSTPSAAPAPAASGSGASAADQPPQLPQQTQRPVLPGPATEESPAEEGRTTPNGQAEGSGTSST